MKNIATQHHSTTAIVLRLVEFSETSLVVTLLTRDLGRISALAKGARRLKGPFEGSLDLLSVCRITLIAKSSDTLDLLTESKLRRRFRGGERSLTRTYAGYYVAETLRWWLDDAERHEELFDLTLATLGLIDGEGPVAETLLAYDCQCLRLLGHAPATRGCTACGVKLDSPDAPAETFKNGRPRRKPKVAFSLDGGGIVCETCRPRQSSLVLISAATLECLDGLLQAPEHDADEDTRIASMEGPIERESVFPLRSLLPRVSETSYPELRGLISRYMQTLLGRSLRMQAFLPGAIRGR
ncbi:DNA repair protein RecO (recombination protein O) [Rhodopirellula rubra]|uniref:DNA repair protein RecO n=1 Tax=Aporhodopirellula rubra TaxID=980271 RepID=A0A7W5H5N2_9BACT|nr:DNA repair protein RecO [Aporhodopirellula rubra]MBB3206604.1 DNA repair protein RecO (recombination protein O) [Aporhodopirellula rubra]